LELKYEIVVGDCLEVLPSLEDETVDLIVTDPPYCSQIEWDKKDISFQLEWLAEAKRILKDGGSIYVFFAPLNMLPVLDWFSRNFTLKNIACWHHPNLYGAGMRYGKDRWKSTWDAILYGTKGPKAKHGINVASEAYKRYGRGFDVFIIPDPRPKLHKAQKPLELIERLIGVSSLKGDLVLDPFLGSGTTMLACVKLARSCIGIEIDPRFAEIARKRCFGQTFLDRKVSYNFRIW